MAPAREALLTEWDGRRVLVKQEGGEHEVVLRTAGACVVERGPASRGQARQPAANPELVLPLLPVGALAVIYELASPTSGVGVLAVGGTETSDRPGRPSEDPSRTVRGDRHES
ncbi:hypothetical protein [Streptomyces sp. NPDC047706]|uniref:hypothetical protein n=1 Tax=Streptomyces sp. NPDC047706 TaxID=3365486 RepID=UPI00371B9E6A